MKHINAKNNFISIFCTVFVFLLYFFTNLSLSAFASTEEKNEKTIFYLSSFTPSYAWDIEIMQYLRSGLKEAGFEVKFHEEFLDTRALNESTKQDVYSLTYELYKKKYADTRFDLIVVNEEIEFMLEYGKKLFPNTPMLFCAISEHSYEKLKTFENITATIDVRNPSTLFSFILETFPKTENIYLIFDNSLGSQMMKPFMSEFEEVYKKINFIYLKPQSLNELELLLKNPLKESVIVDTSYFSSPPLGTLLSQDRKALAFEVTALPLFTVWNKAVGFGAIAGQEVPVIQHGNTLAKLAVEILTKKENYSFEPSYIKDTPLLVDYEMLKHFNISEDYIPADTIVINKPLAFYQEYEKLLVIIAIILVIGSTSIFILFLALRQKKLEKKALLVTLENQKNEQKLKEQLAYREKMEALEAFSSGIAHDINGVFHVISGCVELIEEEIDKKSIIYEDLKQIKEVNEKGQSLLKKFWNPNTNLENINKKQILDEELVKLLPSLEKLIPKHISLHYKNDFCDAKTSLSSDEIYQVFYNLITNAVHAFDSNSGDIHIYIKKQINKTKEYISIAFRDNASGIDLKNLNFIFQPYYTTKKAKGHVGYGLFSLHNIINSHKGKVSVQSTINKGSEFIIILPAHREE